MNWTGKRVLVTGAGGFIGSHLVELLVGRSARVRTFVRYNSRGSFGWLANLDSEVFGAVEVVQGDLRDADTVMRAVRGCDVVFHLGAMISIPYSYANPSEAVAVNVNGTLNVLNACRLLGAEKIVHTSTSETYGTARYVPIDEKHELHGQSPYSASKIGADMLAESFCRSFDLPVAIIRPFNTYGPRQSARALIPTVMIQLLTRSELSLGSLTPTRDFTYVTDTALGMLRAAEVAETSGKVINLGSGSEINVADLVALIGRVTGRTAEIRQQMERIRPEKSEVNRLLSDNRLARNVMGWQPTVSLEQGLLQTFEWLRAHLADYQRAATGYVI